MNEERAPEICPSCKTGTLLVVGPAPFPDRQRVRLQCDACGHTEIAEIGPLYRVASEPQPGAG